MLYKKNDYKKVFIKKVHYKKMPYKKSFIKKSYKKSIIKNSVIKKITDPYFYTSIFMLTFLYPVTAHGRKSVRTP